MRRTLQRILEVQGILLCALLLFAQPLAAQNGEWQGTSLDLNDPQVMADLEAAPRAVNTCGTGVGQTPFTISAQCVSNYNGFCISCNGVCDAIVNVTVVGGIGPFTYNWVGGPTTATWNNVCVGNKIVIVTDQGQAIQCATTVNVSDPAKLTVLFSGVTLPACHDVCDGSAISTAVGGVSLYTYSWNNGTETGPVATQLCAGPNTLVVTDANNCVFDTTFILDVQPIDPMPFVTDVSCFGVCDGMVELAPTGGTGTYIYDWTPDPPNGDGTPDATGLCAGPISVTISDSNGCDTTINLMIMEPSPIEPNATVVEATCANVCDASATVFPSGGLGPYDYFWTPEPGGGQNTNSAIGLCPGLYSVLITDTGSGCDTTVTLTIGSPPFIDPQPSSTNVTCFGTCNGTATVIPVGGTPGYDYFWSPEPGAGQNTNAASLLCAGTYTVLITDLVGCDTLVSFLIEEPTQVLPNEIWTDATCADSCNGTAAVAATGGTPPYSYFWSPPPGGGQNTANATGLCAGIWSVTITDSLNCDTTVMITIAEPPPITSINSQTDVSCNGSCDGSATAQGAGGTGTLAYSWDPAPPIGQGTPTASQLCAGVWTVTITDVNLCQLEVPFIIAEPFELQVTVNVTDPSCGDICDGGAEALVTGGTPPYAYSWDPPPGGGQGTDMVSGICLGTYTLTVTDSLGCDTVIPFTIDTPPLIIPNETVTQPSCPGECDGSIITNATGGTGFLSYDWDPSPPNGDGTPNATALCPGTWTLTIVDNTGCDTTLSWQIIAPLPIDISSSFTEPICFGGDDGTATIMDNANTVSAYLWSPPPGGGQGTNMATGLSAGNWSVLVTDTSGCDTTVNFMISDPPAIDPGLVTLPATCGGNCDGSAIATPTGGAGGGTNNYTYFWDPPPGGGQFTNTATGLCPGLYTLLVTDSLGCDTTIQFTINTPSGIQATATPTDASCFDVCDGSILIDPIVGAPPFSFVWNPQPLVGQGTPQVSGLCAGQWTVVITDSLLCDTVIVLNVGAPDEILPNETFTNESCQGPCDGAAVVNPTGGAGGFEFFWTPTPPQGQFTNSASQLCAGQWQVTITDISGCDTAVTFTILPAQPIIPNFFGVDATCPGVCDGIAAVSPTGGVGPYSYLWSPNPPFGQGTDSISGLCEGNWTVTITDSLGCDTTFSFTILKPGPINPNLVVQDETCDGPCTGAAGVFPLGGNGGYSYFWDPQPDSGQFSNIAYGFCAGQASITITDTVGCDTTVFFTIGPFVPIVPMVVTTDATCPGECDGTAIASATGGEAPYSYFWTPEPPNGQADTIASGLCPGTYLLTVTDANNCDTSISFTIGQTPAMMIALDVVDVDCAGDCTGSITLTTTAGTAPYDYAWTDPDGLPMSNDSAQTGLCAGTYTIVVTDANLCDTTLSIDVVEPLPIMLSGSNVPADCQVCSGSASVTVSGGTAPYTYAWVDGNNTPIGTDSTTVDSLCAGLYTVTVTDVLGCTEVLAVAVPDNDGEMLSTTAQATSCAATCDGTATVLFTCNEPNCTVAWFDFQGNDLMQDSTTAVGLCAGDYLVQVTNGLGCISFDTVTVTSPPALVANLSTTQVSCGGNCDGVAIVAPSGGIPPYDYEWLDQNNGLIDTTAMVSGLCAGTYSVTITDATLCDTTIGVLIIEPPLITINAVVQDATCNGLCDGSIVLSPAGGTGPFSYAWTPVPPNGNGSNGAFDLCAGDWTVTISDSLGCDTSITYTIGQPAAIAVLPTVSESNCGICNGAASVEVTGGTAPYTYAWIDQNNSPIGSDSSITGLCAGLYQVTVTDALDCELTQLIIIQDSDGEVTSVSSAPSSCQNVCDGEATVSFNCTAPNCTVVWYDALGNVILQSGNTITGLCPGDYFVQVTNASGCITFDTATVASPPAIVANLSTTSVTCNGACDGTATIGATGGIGPFTYQWLDQNNVPIGSSPQITDLCAGNYSVTITDSTLCDTTIGVLILEPAIIMVSAVTSDASCNGICDGSIVLSPTGGNGGFTYAWSPVPPNGDGSNGAFDLCAGDWSVTITDSAGCDTTITYTIDEPAPITITTIIVESQCLICNGEISVVVNGGTMPYSYAWADQNNVPVGTDSLITGLCAGLYTVTVTDDQGCEETQLVALQDSDGEVLTSSSVPTSCPGSCDGQASVQFNCSDPQCVIAWYDIQGNDLQLSDPTIIDLCAGDYLVQVTNASGCISFETVTVLSPPVIEPDLTTTPVTCNGDCDGTAMVDPTGGTGPFTYLWLDQNNSTISFDAMVTGLCAGSYTVTITDSTLCDTVINVLITEPDPLLLNAVIDQATCSGGCDASIVLSPTGGNGGYTYAWSPVPPNGDSTNAAIDLCEGTWTVTVTDSLGCDTTITFNITDPPVLDVLLALVDNACADDCAGSAAAIISGGAPPYSVIWSIQGGGVIATDTLQVSDLCNGNYVLSISDSLGCILDTVFVINSLSNLDPQLTVINETCLGPCDGMATINVTGGVGTLVYLWDPPPTGGQGTPQATGLCVGAYTVTVTDSLGCDTIVPFNILPYTSLDDNAATQNVSCFGACDGQIITAPTGGNLPLTYFWDPVPPNGQGTTEALDLCAGTYTLLISDATGCDSLFTYVITEPDSLYVTVDAVVDAVCSTSDDGSISVTINGGVVPYSHTWVGPNGFNSNQEDIDQLEPGVYNLFVLDDVNCQTTLSVTVGTQIIILADAGADTSLCEFGTADLSGANSIGATTWTWNDPQGNVLGQGVDISLGSLSPGTNTVILTVTDGGQCVDLDTVLVNVFNAPIADAGPDQSVIGDQTATLGGDPTGPFGSTYIWQPDSTLSDPFAADPVADPFQTTWYVVTVTDQNGCSSIDSVLITVLPEIVIPSGFSPNGDGMNDIWEIDLIDRFPESTVQIYNRWGELLFESVGYLTPWDGKYEGKLVPTGTYYYAIELNDPQYPDPFTGPLTVIR